MMMRQANLSQKIIQFLKSPFSFKIHEHAPDYVFISALGILVSVGLLLLSSASSVVSFQEHGNSYYLFKHQLMNGLLPGIAAFYLASKINYQIWKKWSFWMLIGSFVLLIAVFLPVIGAYYGTSSNSINLGFVSFQPTEVVKLIFLIWLAGWLEKKGSQGLRDPQYGFIPFAAVLAIICFLVLIQPDTGTLAIIIALAFAVYYLGGGPKKYLAYMICGFLVMVFIAIQIAPYRLNRITAFLKPNIDPQDTGYQINQAKIAIGSGGFLGLGIGKSRQKFSYLPEVYGDSIFAVIAEEMGFVFSSIIVGLFLLIFLRGLHIARGSPDQFGKLLAAGITCWLVFQAFINIGGIAGIMPLTGVPLPFVSYGGTATVVGLFGCGILVNISKQTRLL